MSCRLLPSSSGAHTSPPALAATTISKSLHTCIYRHRTLSLHSPPSAMPPRFGRLASATTTTLVQTSPSVLWRSPKQHLVKDDSRTSDGQPTRLSALPEKASATNQVQCYFAAWFHQASSNICLCLSVCRTDHRTYLFKLPRYVVTT